MNEILKEVVIGILAGICIFFGFVLLLHIRAYAAEPGTLEYCTPANEEWVLYGDECTTTCYCLCRKCCGKNWAKAVCADGTTPERYLTVANGKLPFGTRVYIEGVGYREVHDRGSKVGANHFDIYVGVQNHEYARQWGSQKRRVWVVKEK